MTKYDFYKAIAELETAPADVRSQATEVVAKMEADKAKAKAKSASANQPIKDKIIELVSVAPKVASDLANSLNVSTQKASAICGQLVKDGKLTSNYVKFPGHSKVLCYSLVKGEDGETA